MAFTFLLLSLAVYRICRLVIDDTLFDKPREAFKRRFPPDREYARWSKSKVVLRSGEKPVSSWSLSPTPKRKPNKIAEGIFCYWCLSMWVAGIAVVLLSNLTSVPLPVLWWLACSAVVGLVARNLDA